MSNLNDFYNNNSNGNNNNNTNNTDSINDFFNTNPNQELEIEDTRNLVDAPDLNYKKEIDNKPSRQINDNSNIINQNNLPNARFEREYHFDDGSDKKTIIKNIILISIVIIVGFFLVYNYSGVRDTSPQQETPVEEPTPVEPTPQPEQSTPATQDQPVVQEDGTITHQEDEVYLEVSTSRTISGSGIEQIGKEQFYKTDINREINSNGVSFIIKKVNNKGVTIVLNTELIDTTSSVGCKKSLCTVGTEITLDGKITVIFETPGKENKINYSFNVYNIRY